MVGTVFKANIGDLEEMVSKGCSRNTWKELTRVVQRIYGKERFLVNF